MVIHLGAELPGEIIILLEEGAERNLFTRNADLILVLDKGISSESHRHVESMVFESRSHGGLSYLQ